MPTLLFVDCIKFSTSMLCSVEMTQAFISNETNIELAFIYLYSC